MFISLKALMGFIPEFYMKRVASLQLLSSQKIFETSLLLKELLYDWRTADISAIHKRAVNQNSAITVLSLSLVLSANSLKKL